MTYEEAKALLPDAAHIYTKLTIMEVVNCPVDKRLTEVGGVTLLGTTQPYTAVAAKELLPE